MPSWLRDLDPLPIVYGGFDREQRAGEEAEMVVGPELDEGDEAAAGGEVGPGEGPARVEVAHQIAAGRPKLGESLKGIAGQPAVCRVCAGGRRTWMADDELVAQFDDLSLVGREGEVVLERPERTSSGYIPALDADRDRQGLE